MTTFRGGLAALGDVGLVHRVRHAAFAIKAEEYCRVYWGSHGCDLPRGHIGPHVCETCWEPDGDNRGYVGRPPYYGPDTHFYGEDAGDVTACTFTPECPIHGTAGPRDPSLADPTETIDHAEED